MIDVQVQVIIPVHNAATTIVDAVDSAMTQIVPQHLSSELSDYSIRSFICCYNDGSTDGSLDLLEELQKRHNNDQSVDVTRIPAELLIESGEPARGAGFARNQAVKLLNKKNKPNTELEHQFLCLLDSDDIMNPNRIAEQLSFMLGLDVESRGKALVGCNFDRIPPDSTWHYASWANNLTDERLMLERYREVTILQPTWMMCKSRWLELGGEIEVANSNQSVKDIIFRYTKESPFCLIHPDDTLQTLRLAEDLRFFHTHLYSDGVLYLHRTRTKEPLVTYRHTGTSQSFKTSRKLLLSLRAKAFEESVLKKDSLWQTKNDGRFVVWGAGRDGKDFIKALDPESRKRIYCFVDVDEKKIGIGFYINRDLDLRVPIVHFSMLARDPLTRHKLQQQWEEGMGNNEVFGRINKRRPGSEQNNKTENENSQKSPKKKKRKINNRKADSSVASDSVDAGLLPQLPVVVCVAMYRTNGVLEDNVKSIGREEGVDLWHFS